ncbi:hypothetical protein JTB14_000586 [Gonioctena quinquepunctata]|nr:hypothetical protein JTB14_000586 [Gonioctena quinquepunctata]
MCNFGCRPGGYYKKTLDSKGVTEARFVSDRPGHKWMKNFLKRQGEMLKTRLSHNRKCARAAVSSEGITKYFEEIQSSLKDIPSEAIINYDETSMQDNPGKIEIIVRRICIHHEKIDDSSKTAFSVMFAGTASGVMYHTWMEGGPTGIIDRSLDGLRDPFSRIDLYQ